MYIELTPGTRAGGFIHDGGRIPTSHISPTVELDEIFRTFDPKTRRALQTWFQGQAVALAGRGGDINSAIGRLPEFTGDTTELLRVLNSQGEAVSRLVRDTGTLFDAVSERKGQLQSLMTNGERATSAFAARNRELGETFQALPTFEREGKKTVERLTKTALAGDEFVKDARPAARAFGPAFREVDAITPDFKGLLAGLDDLTKAGRRGQPAFQRTTASFQRFFATLPQPLNHLNPILELLKEHRLDFMSFMINVTAATNAQSIPRGSTKPEKYLRAMAMLDAGAAGALRAPPAHQPREPLRAAGPVARGLRQPQLLRQALARGRLRPRAPRLGRRRREALRAERRQPRGAALPPAEAAQRHDVSQEPRNPTQRTHPMKHPRKIRRAAVATACVAACAAAAPAQAFSPPVSELSVGAKLLDQPVGKPWAVALLLGATIKTNDGSEPPPVKKMVFKFPNATVNGNDFPTCTAARLRAKGPSVCPKGSRIGGGLATVDARPLLQTPVVADLDLYNGPGNNKSRKVVLLGQARQIEVTLVLEGTLKKLSGRFGYQLDLPVPDIPTVAGANPAAIVDFDVTVQARGRKGGRKTSYIEAPRACGRVLPFTRGVQLRRRPEQLVRVEHLLHADGGQALAPAAANRESARSATSCGRCSGTKCPQPSAISDREVVGVLARSRARMCGAPRVALADEEEPGDGQPLCRR